LEHQVKPIVIGGETLEIQDFDIVGKSHTGESADFSGPAGPPIDAD